MQVRSQPRRRRRRGYLRTRWAEPWCIVRHGQERYDRKLWIVERVTPAAYPPAW